MNLKKILYYLPGVGLVTHTVSEIKKRKGKKPIYNLRDKKDIRALGNYLFQTGYLAFALSSKLIIGAYIGNAFSTGDWNIFKSKTEQIKEESFVREKNLENKIKESKDSLLNELKFY